MKCKNRADIDYVFVSVFVRKKSLKRRIFNFIVVRKSEIPKQTLRFFVKINASVILIESSNIDVVSYDSQKV